MPPWPRVKTLERRAPGSSASRSRTTHRILSGVASDSADGVQAGLALSVVILLVGAVVFLGQRPHAAHAGT